MYRVEICPDADKDHWRCKRSYAHTFHKKGVICVSEKLLSLPMGFYLGILLHEVGHLVIGEEVRHTEEEADLVGGEIAGSRIDRKDSNLYGRNLEWIESNKHRNKAKEFLRKVIQE